MEQPLVTASVTVQQGDPTLPLSYKAVRGPLSTSQYSLHVSQRRAFSTASVVGVSLKPGYCLQNKTKQNKLWAKR